MSIPSGTTIYPKPKEKELEEVDVIASGYEWDCPKCGVLNKEIEWTDTFRCPICGETVKAAIPDHAYG